MFTAQREMNGTMRPICSPLPTPPKLALWGGKATGLLEKEWRAEPRPAVEG